jgi:hypothetical protein
MTKHVPRPGAVVGHPGSDPPERVFQFGRSFVRHGMVLGIAKSGATLVRQWREHTHAVLVREDTPPRDTHRP